MRIFLVCMLLFAGAYVENTAFSTLPVHDQELGVHSFSFLSEIFTIPKAYAQTGGDDSVEGLMNATTKFFGQIIGVLYPFIYVLISMAEALLDPGNIFTPEIQVALRKIWLLSRNITNTVFAIMLFAGAIILIFRPTSEKFNEVVKEKLPRFVIAVILVNFSWFFPRVIIDASNVLASVIFRVPLMLGVKCVDPGDKSKECLIAAHVEFFPEHKPYPPGPANTEALCRIRVPGFERFIHKEPHGYFDRKGVDTILDVCFVPWSKAQKNTQGRILNGLVTNFGLLRTMPEVTPMPTDSSSGTAALLKTALAWVSKFGFTAFAILVLFFPLLALVVVLLMRWGVLWLTIAFMPFTFIGYALTGKLTTKIKEAPDIWEYFLGAALLPVVVAIPFSVGFILVNAGYSFGTIQHETTFRMGTPIMTNVADLNHIVWFSMTLAILWKGTFMALKSVSYAQGIVGKIEGFGGGLIKAAAMAPTLIPLPIGKGKGDELSLAAAMQLGRGLPSLPDTIASQQAQNWKERRGLTAPSTAATFMGMSDAVKRERISEFNDLVKRGKIASMSGGELQMTMRDKFRLDTLSMTEKQFEEEWEKLAEHAKQFGVAEHEVVKWKQDVLAKKGQLSFRGTDSGDDAGKVGVGGPTVIGFPLSEAQRKILESPRGNPAEVFNEMATRAGAAGTIDKAKLLDEVGALRSHAKENEEAKLLLSEMEADIRYISDLTPTKAAELASRYGKASTISSTIDHESRRAIALHEEKAGRGVSNLELGHVYEQLKEKTASGALVPPIKAGESFTNAYVAHIGMLEGASRNDLLRGTLAALKEKLGALDKAATQAQVKDVVDQFSSQIIQLTIGKGKESDAVNQQELLNRALLKKAS
jgi:hypothetical protein